MLAVEVAGEVLGAGAAGDGLRADDQHPLGLLGVAVDRKREQVGALPHAAGGARGAEVALVGPLLEVGRGVEGDLALVREGDGHQPALGGGVPEDLGIAEVRRVDVQDRVAGVLGPGGAAVGAEGEGLFLLAGRLLLAGVDGDERRVGLGAEAGAVVLVEYDAAGKDHLVVVLGDGQRELLPVHQVGADRVTPRHVAPGVARRVVLEEQVILTLVPDQAVGVVHPVLRRGEVELGPVLLVVEPGVGRGRPTSRASSPATSASPSAASRPRSPT